jgi:hypothetical protein
MTKQEIKAKIDSIIDKMQSSFDVLWEDNLGESTQVIRTGEWLDELFELQKTIEINE